MANKKSTLKTEYWSIDKVIPYEKNAKIHSDKQIEKLAASIEQFGFNQDIVVDENGVILAGHGRRLAALKLGMKEVSVKVVRDLTEQQKKAYRIADNKAASVEYDDEMLAQEVAQILSHMNETEVFDIGSIGMDDEEINGLFERYSIDSLIESVGGILDEDDEQDEIDSRAESQTRPLPKEVAYEKAYSIIIDCSGEDEQRELYDQLIAQGRRCKIMTM